MSEEPEFWWVVSELTDFSAPTPGLPFPVQVQNPPHCLGWFGVFGRYDAAVEFAGGQHAKVQCLKVTRPAVTRG